MSEEDITMSEEITKIVAKSLFSIYVFFKYELMDPNHETVRQGKKISEHPSEPWLTPTYMIIISLSVATGLFFSEHLMNQHNYLVLKILKLHS